MISPVTSYFIEEDSIGSLKAQMTRLVVEGSRRDVSLDTRLEIRESLKLIRRQMKARRSRLDLIYGK